MPFAQPVNPYVEYDPRESFVSVRECAEVLNIGEERVRELARRGTLRSRGKLVPVVAALDLVRWELSLLRLPVGMRGGDKKLSPDARALCLALGARPTT